MELSRGTTAILRRPRKRRSRLPPRLESTILYLSVSKRPKCKYRKGLKIKLERRPGFFPKVGFQKTTGRQARIFPGQPQSSEVLQRYSLAYNLHERGIAHQGDRDI